MQQKIPNELMEKLNTLSIELSLIESLSRILLEEIRFGDDLENFDDENLSVILKQKIIENSKAFRIKKQELEFGA